MLLVAFVSRCRCVKISVADPVHFFRIRIPIRGSGFLNPDPDPGDPKKTGSDRIRIRIRIPLRYVLDVQQNNIFLTNLSIL